MRIIRLSEVMHNTGLSRSTIYRHVADGSFPKPVPLSDRVVGWLDSEVTEWILERIELREENKAVVKDILAKVS